MSLEAILRQYTDEAEDIIKAELNIDALDVARLNKSKPEIKILDTIAYAAYDFLDNTYIFSRHLANDILNIANNKYAKAKNAAKVFLAVGEEVSHSIRLRLNARARDYLLNPINGLRKKIKEYM